MTRWAFVAGWILAGTGVAVALNAEDAPTTSSRASHPPAASSSRIAGGGVTPKMLEAKLNEILENQQKILKRLDEVMAELQIVKIRATVR
ncbi:MAG: hypothetical protein HY599_02200 [Candidatus Omnitrophica bacterium]|nr:hypothetical protein [Candidatus Omnitrophota bacterium]